MSSCKLSQKGHEEAVQFGRHDMWIVPNRIYAPPMDQYLEFASILLPAAKVEPLMELSDRCMGSLTERSYRETMAEFPRRNWLSWQRSFWTAPPDGESLFDISDRIIGVFVSKILPIPSAETVLMLCPPDVMRILVGYLTHAEEADIPKISVDRMIPYVINGNIGNAAEENSKS